MLPGVVNIGVRPTVTAGRASGCWNCIFSTSSGDLYGEDIEVTFRAFLRRGAEICRPGGTARPKSRATPPRPGRCWAG